MSEGRGALVNFLLFFRGSGGREREGFPMISDFLGFLILLMRAAPIKTLKNRILAQGRLCTSGSEWAVHLGGL